MDFAEAILAAPEKSDMLKKGMEGQQYDICLLLLTRMHQMPLPTRAKFELKLSVDPVYSEFYDIVRQVPL